MAHLTIEAAKKSNIALMAVDKGLYILNSENKLSRDDVFKDLLTYDKSCGYTSADSKGVFDVRRYSTVLRHGHVQFVINRLLD